jgi:hypothetical protein
MYYLLYNIVEEAYIINISNINNSNPSYDLVCNRDVATRFVSEMEANNYKYKMKEYNQIKVVEFHNNCKIVDDFDDDWTMDMGIIIDELNRADDQVAFDKEKEMIYVEQQLDYEAGSYYNEI